MSESSIIPTDSSLCSLPFYNPKTNESHPVMTEQFMHIYHSALEYSMLKVGEELHFRNLVIYEEDYIH